MKYILTSVIIFSLSSCSNSFINHRMNAEKIGACNQQTVPVKMISNINGERYEFNYCLDEDFNGKNYSIERKGDSLLLKFPAATKKTALYKLTLDIDAKPAYHHIVLGDQTLEIVTAERI